MPEVRELHSTDEEMVFCSLQRFPIARSKKLVLETSAQRHKPDNARFTLEKHGGQHSCLVPFKGVTYSSRKQPVFRFVWCFLPLLSEDLEY